MSSEDPLCRSDGNDTHDEHGITPKTIYKSVEDVMMSTRVADAKPEPYGKKKDNKGQGQCIYIFDDPYNPLESRDVSRR